VAHLGFHLEEHFPELRQVVFPFPISPTLVFQKIEVVLPGQGAVRDDFAHQGLLKENLSSNLADLNEKG
jgi:hypothetical protein